MARRKKEFDFKVAAPKELSGVLLDCRSDVKSKQKLVMANQAWIELRARNFKVSDISRLVGETTMDHLIDHLELSDDELVMCLTLNSDVARRAWTKLYQRLNETNTAKVRLVWRNLDPKLRPEIMGQLGRARVA